MKRNIRFNIQEGADGLALGAGTFDIAVVGARVDDRSEAAIEFLRSISSQLVKMSYDPDSFIVNVDGRAVGVDDFESEFNAYRSKRIIWDATSLGFVEVFLAAKLLLKPPSSYLTYMYVEPDEYGRSKLEFRAPHLVTKRDFELSEEVRGYRAVPTATALLSDRVEQKVIFFLGFEERRLDRALEDHQMIKSNSVCVVFGVPAYMAGWEMDAFHNNIRVIDERKIQGGAYFCGANNPVASFLLLDRFNATTRLIVAPLGTKPMGIGAAVFAAINSEVGLLYDHPQKKTGRSTEIRTWHLYSISESQ